MQILNRLLPSSSCCLAILLALTSSAGAQSKSSPSEEYPGPWQEITQVVRGFLSDRKVHACSEAVGRQSSRNSDEYLLYCTQDEKHWTSWRVQPATHKLRGPGKLIEGIPPPSADYR